MAAARLAFDAGPWPRTGLDERLAVVAELRRLLAQHQDDIARLQGSEAARLLAEVRSGLAAA